MTTVSYTAQAMLVAAVEAIETANREHKKATGAPLFRLASDLGNGVTLRDLKHWHKEFKAKQAEAAPAPAPKATETKTPAAKVSAPKENAAPEIKAADLRDQIVLLGRAKETVVRISRNKATDTREAVTASGLRIALGDIERNNRGTFRVKESAIANYAKKGETVAPKAPAVKEEKLSVEKEAIRQYPIRVLKIKPSALLKAAEYDRNTQTLFATFNDGARWAYEAVSLSDVRALENATSAGKHFVAHIRDNRKGRMVKGEKTPAAKADAKPAAAAPVAKAAAKTEVSTTRLRAEGFIDGRKHEVVEAIQRNKTTGVRSVVTQSGKRIPLDSIVEVKGKFRVAEVAENTPAAKPAENTRKTAASKPAETKAPRANFDKAEAKQHKVEATPTIADLKENGLRLVKGARSKVVGVLRVVRRDDVRVAVLSDGKTAVPFAQVAMLDGQPTFVGKLVAAQFNAVEALH
ncbi:hypothetical protein LU11_gp007 [Pseudomonas phage Lu11]|uniref:hypothetical protein n=1 Tax=Pseudomonas phage Lu11 TaxID=1161927 RepID=UPI00025F14E1|nr:hypothetical protein LU11_gp007 [Pseudomonas phage Lu11]AFH14538.1 hypothetical protein Lu11_0007 [Pseudomonas phage Lu11]